MELTKEHLDQALKGLATKEDIQKAIAPLATKEDVRREVREGVEELARIVSAGFDDIRDRLDVRERVSRVEHDLQRIAKELHISL